MSLRGKLTVAGLALGLALGFSASVSAQGPTEAPERDGQRGERGRGDRGPRHRGKRGGDRGFLRILRQLDLTEAQAAQARTIIENHMAATSSQREELMRLREQREQNGAQADVSNRAKELRQQLQESAKAMRAQLLTILTADQRAKFDQMETDFKARRERMREGRPPIPQEHDQ
jgi:Spy/CpxP family protein refolding chaperone